MRALLIKYFITVTVVTNVASIFALGVLFFFGSIFTQHSDLASLEAYRDLNSSFLAMSPFVFSSFLSLIIFYPAYRIVFLKEPILSRKAKMLILHTPSLSSVIAFSAWIFSIVQLLFFFWYKGMEFSFFIVLNVEEQLTTGIAAYSVTYFMLDYLNKNYFIERLFPENRLEQYKKGGAELSFERKINIYFLSVGIFPLVSFGGVLYFLYKVNGSIFTQDQYMMLGLFIVILFLIGAFLTQLVIMTFKKPIDKIRHATDKIKHGNFDIDLRVTSIDELGNLMERINQMAFEINKLNAEISATQKEVVFTMGAIGESRSRETGNHVKRVAEYSYLLATLHGMDEESAELLREASPMHDIGKVAIPDDILNKPAKLSDEEFAVMKNHARLGYEMLAHSNRALLKTAAVVAFSHHEKWDGSGYPSGLIGEHIPLEGRITALADVFDALGSDRVYKSAWEDEKIFGFFQEQSGKHFDPKLIELFFEHLDEFLSIRERFRDELI